MGSAVNGHSRTSPRTPCGAPICATQTRSFFCSVNGSARALARLGSGGGLRSRGCGLGGFLGKRLALLARHRLFRIVPRLALAHAGLIKEAHDAVGRLRALVEPGL